METDFSERCYELDVKGVTRNSVPGLLNGAGTERKLWRQWMHKFDWNGRFLLEIFLWSEQRPKRKYEDYRIKIAPEVTRFNVLNYKMW